MSFLNNWREEMQSAYLYRELAQVEHEDQKSALFLALARAAEEQSKTWAAKIVKDHGSIPATYIPGLRAKIVVYLIRKMGPKRILPVLAAMKVRGLSIYKYHKHLSGHVMPTSVEEVGHRHKGVEAGGNFRAGVFGMNDGLVSNASLIMGMAGAGQDVHALMLTGVAGMLAGAFSMAAGEYVSVRSQRELFEYQIGLEREELNEYPEEEAEELALIYAARGIPMDKARQIAKDMMQDPEHALDTLAKEELGLDPVELGSPWGAALSSFVSFSGGAMVPLMPFVLGATDIKMTMGVTLLSLFIVGALLSLFTGRNAWYSGLRMVVIGALAGLTTYLVGALLGIGWVNG